ncbi:Fur family transcriptional regulator [Spiroplasma endosymbiont of Crioceris asparagi]|uniref:Fur family transcriptional regulator n=1 Tax=Spiroplasma endosymbiont of Crioceris asparagi TaxID=3066286 RepID=UPI0030D0BFC9
MVDESIKDFYLKRLKELKIKITDLRLLIIDVLASKSHFNINELIEILKTKIDKVNVMSVYNNIDLFLEKHLIYANTFNGKLIIYEAIKPYLVHIKCDECDKIIDLEDKNLNEKLQSTFKEFSKKTNIEINHYKIEMHGACKEHNK